MNPAVLQSAGVIAVAVLVFWALCRLEIAVERRRGCTQVPIEPLPWTDERS